MSDTRKFDHAGTLAVSADTKKNPRRMLGGEPTEGSREWKKGDTRTIDGEEYESDGHVDEQSGDDLQKKPTILRDRHFWLRKEKLPKEVPTS